MKENYPKKNWYINRRQSERRRARERGGVDEPRKREKIIPVGQGSPIRNRHKCISIFFSIWKNTFPHVRSKHKSKSTYLEGRIYIYIKIYP